MNSSRSLDSKTMSRIKPKITESRSNNETPNISLRDQLTTMSKSFSALQTKLEVVTDVVDLLKGFKLELDQIRQYILTYHILGTSLMLTTNNQNNREVRDKLDQLVQNPVSTELKDEVHVLKEQVRVLELEKNKLFSEYQDLKDEVQKLSRSKTPDVVPTEIVVVPTEVSEIIPIVVPEPTTEEVPESVLEKTIEKKVDLKLEETKDVEKTN